MEKLKLNIVGLSYSQTQSGAYALVLGEEEGKRRLPIIIGGFEAQAIAIELEDMTPSRPLTHDLFKGFADLFEITVKEVLIYNLVEGIFFAKLIIDKNGEEEELDARTSDAVALAVRFKCEIYTYEFIMSSAGIILDDDMKVQEEGEEEEGEEGEESKKADIEVGSIGTSKEELKNLSLEELNKKLEEVIAQEDYETASNIRDEIKRREKE
ncbi:MAG: bifunctional nuclease domain-containing protein [Flavobacteriales bacterium]